MKLFIEKADATLLGTRGVAIRTRRKDLAARDIVKLVNPENNVACGAIVRSIEDGDGHISMDRGLQDFLGIGEDALIVAEKLKPPEARAIRLEGLGCHYDRESIGEIAGDIKRMTLGKPLCRGMEVSEYRHLGHLKVGAADPDDIVIVAEATAFELFEAGVTKNKASIGNPGEPGGKEMEPIEKPKINFSDVGGLEAVKENIRMAIVYPFERPEVFAPFKRGAGDGILLYGPPGCGKTFIATAAAGECKASFFSVKISDILGSYVGESERNLRAAFESAKKHAPCILFLDEIDGIGGRRVGGLQEHSKRLVNELLTLMDGVEKTHDVLVLAATNAPWDVDPALRRPGRFSKLVLIPPPDGVAREEIFRIQLKDRPVESGLDYKKLARATEGFSSADIKQVCRDAEDIVIKEALKARKPVRNIGIDDLDATIKARNPSLVPWFRLAREQIARSNEQDMFKELMAIIDEQGIGY